MEFLRELKNSGCLNTMHILLVYLQQAPLVQHPLAAVLLLQLDLLVPSRDESSLPLIRQAINILYSPIQLFFFAGRSFAVQCIQRGGDRCHDSCFGAQFTEQKGPRTMCSCSFNLGWAVFFFRRTHSRSMATKESRSRRFPL